MRKLLLLLLLVPSLVCAETVVKDSTDVTLEVMCYDTTTFLGKTGLDNTDFGTTEYYRDGGADVSDSAVTFDSNCDEAHKDYLTCEKDATAHPGLYRVDLEDAAFATGAESVTTTLTATDTICPSLTVDLVDTGMNLASSVTGCAVGSVCEALANFLSVTTVNTTPSISAPSVDMQTLYDYSFDVLGNLAGSGDITVYITPQGVNTYVTSSGIFTSLTQEVTTDGTGKWEAEVPQGANLHIKGDWFECDITVTTDAQKALHTYTACQ